MIYPDQVKFERGMTVLDFPPIWFEVVPNDDSFKKLMLEINGLLNGLEPAPSANCAWCKYRQASRPGHALQTDLPF